MIKIAFHPDYVIDLPPNHRFPMEKYALLPQQLRYEGTYTGADFFTPQIPKTRHFLAVHQQDYFNELLQLNISRKAERQIGFPLSRDFIERERRIAGGTLEASKYALHNGIGLNCSGGTHHAYSNHGEGFCMLNDQALAARYLLRQNLAQKILIIDLDVHQGNGTAEIFAGDDSVFTFSMHGQNNYPFTKEKSDWDIGLEDGTGDNAYLEQLQQALPRLIEKVKPDFIFYLGGVDILKTDKLGRLNCSIQGCRARDAYVLKTVKRYGIPLTISMGGGYSKQIRHIVEAHANTFRLAQVIYG